VDGAPQGPLVHLLEDGLEPEDVELGCLLRAEPKRWTKARPEARAHSVAESAVWVPMLPSLVGRPRGQAAAVGPSGHALGRGLLMHRRCSRRQLRRFLLSRRGLGHSTTGTENPRVGGSILPLGTVFAELRRRERPSRPRAVASSLPRSSSSFRASLSEAFCAAAWSGSATSRSRFRSSARQVRSRCGPHEAALLAPADRPDETGRRMPFDK
jgi:hypothetical protein